jgi:hypothetical protein
MRLVTALWSNMILDILLRKMRLVTALWSNMILDILLRNQIIDKEIGLFNDFTRLVVSDLNFHTK